MIKDKTVKFNGHKRLSGGNNTQKNIQKVLMMGITQWCDHNLESDNLSVKSSGPQEALLNKITGN